MADLANTLSISKMKDTTNSVIYRNIVSLFLIRIQICIYIYIHNSKSQAIDRVTFHILLFLKQTLMIAWFLITAVCRCIRHHITLAKKNRRWMKLEQLKIVLVIKSQTQNYPYVTSRALEAVNFGAAPPASTFALPLPPKCIWLVTIPPIYLETATISNCFRFQNPSDKINGITFAYRNSPVHCCQFLKNHSLGSKPIGRPIKQSVTQSTHFEACVSPQHQSHNAMNHPSYRPLPFQFVGMESIAQSHSWRHSFHFWMGFLFIWTVCSSLASPSKGPGKSAPLNSKQARSLSR